ncbi:MAG: hypothetical protein ABIN00_04630 [candidate division WOR-3 bacterium]
MTKKFVLVLLLLVFIYSFSSSIKFGLTDNLFKTNDKISDLLLSLEFNLKKNFEKSDIFFNFDVNTPLTNNYYMNFPSDFLYQLIFKEDINTSFISGIYSYQNLYLNEFYKENNFFTPGIFLDFKKNFNFVYTLKNSFDIYYTYYPFLNTNSSLYSEIVNKNILYFPFNSSFHLNSKAGYKVSDQILLFNITPLISFNLFNAIGLSFSYNFQKVTTKNIDYYYDDSFLDEYFYNKDLSLTGKITFQLNRETKFVFASTYEKIKFNPLVHTVLDSLFAVGEVENRSDNIFNLGLTFIYSQEKNVYNIKYEYVKKESTNPYYNFDSNSLFFSYKF